MHFSMVIFSRKSTCNHLLAILILKIKFVVFAMLSMVLSKLFKPGLLSSVLWSLSRVSPLVPIIQLSSFVIHPLVSLSFFFMWMIWLLQVMTLLASVIYRSSLVNILRWKILALSTIFSVFKSHLLLMVTISLKPSMFLIFSLRPISLIARLFPFP